jgi:large subunit ribosomal protein L30e
MAENLELEKQLKLVKKTGSYIVGRREVSNSLKGSRLLVWSASANVPQLILDECKNLSVPAIKFAGNPVELGRACGIPFRVSVIALKAAGDADLSAFTKAADYHSGVVVTPSKPPLGEPALPKKAAEIKPKREAKKKVTSKPEAKATKTIEAEAEEKKSRKKNEAGKTTTKKAAEDVSKPKKTTRKKKKSDDEDEE